MDAVPELEALLPPSVCGNDDSGLPDTPSLSKLYQAFFKPDTPPLDLEFLADDNSFTSAMSPSSESSYLSASPSGTGLLFPQSSSSETLCMATHKPARGRRRARQLASMSDTEKEMEKQMRLLKNRQSAKDCRRRKKSFIEGLQERIAELESGEVKYLKQLAALNSANKSLLADLERLRKLSK